jgi:tripartite ATP-independent transporter DctP family solute receptor
MKKFRLGIFLGVILALVFSVTSFGKTNTTVIKLAHGVNEKDSFHIAAAKFKELVEKRTKSKVVVKIYPNATLGDERTVIEGLQYGAIDMSVLTSGPVANFLPEISVFEMPFLFNSEKEAYKILDGPIGQKVLDKLDKINLKGLAYAERGFRNLTNSKRPVLKPEDMKGLKIRVMENPLYIDTFKALGANAVPMAWPETLTALQQNAIDGQENPVCVVYSFKLYESQKYLSMTKHTYAPAMFLMGKKVFTSFDKKTQGVLVKAAREAAAYERKWNAAQMGEQLKVLKENGMQIVEPNLARFRAAVKPVFKKYGAKFGKLLNEIQAAKK